MLIEQPHEPPEVPTDPTIPAKFFSVKDAAQKVALFAFDSDGVKVLKTFRAAHAGGFTMAAIQVAGICVENVNQRISRTSAPSLLICS